MIKAVVFDMDGVLFDTESMHIKCMYEAAELLGVRITEEAILGTLGKNQRDQKSFVMNVMEEIYPNGTFPYDIHRKLHDELLHKMLEEAPPAMKGVRELLEFLEQHNIRMAVASSSNYDRVLFNLMGNGLEHYFQTLITGDMLEHSKPDPDIYLKACKALGVEPHEAVAIEDSLSGIIAADAAGMFTVMVPDMIKPTEEFASYYDMLCDSLTEVQEYLEGVVA